MSVQAVQAPYKSKHKIRIVTAASLFDGHDSAINLMRRILQSSGAEVIHLGHDRSAGEVVRAAIQEDVQAIAMTSYQGGHIEYFKYMHDLLKEQGAGHIRVFGGGGGTILQREIEELHNYGITRIYAPDDGRRMGLQGMINDLLEKADFQTYGKPNGQAKALKDQDPTLIARTISLLENAGEGADDLLQTVRAQQPEKIIPVLGITGTGGAGKSSLTDELVRRFLLDFDSKRIAIVSVDPSKRKSGGALLGDRIRMNAIDNERVYMRSMATREANVSVTRQLQAAVDVLKAAEYDLIIVETAGIGQSDTQITEVADLAMYVMTPEYGAATQLEKIDMLDFADIVALNKFDKRGALDAQNAVQKQMQRNQMAWDKQLDDMPVYGTIASQFNDPGMNTLYVQTMQLLDARTGAALNSSFAAKHAPSEKIFIIPPERVRYLAEIVEESRRYEQWIDEQVALAEQSYTLKEAAEQIEAEEVKSAIEDKYSETWGALNQDCRKILESWDKKAPATPPTSTSTRCVAKTSVCRPTPRACRTKRFRGWRCPNTALGAIFCAGACAKTCPASSRTPPACFRSNAKAKTPHGCSPARATPNAPIAASTTSRKTRLLRD